MRAPSTVNTSQSPAASTAAVAPRTGELLSLAVREAFRTREYRRVTNRKHSVELLQAGVAALHAGGVERFGAYVEHDNVPMLRLYESIGCELIRIAGALSVRVEGNVGPVLQALTERLAST